MKPEQKAEALRLIDRALIPITDIEAAEDCLSRMTSLLRTLAAEPTEDPDLTLAYMAGYEKGKDAGIVIERARNAADHIVDSNKMVAPPSKPVDFDDGDTGRLPATGIDDIMALALAFADSHVRLEGANTTQSLQICSFRVEQDEDALRTAIQTALDEAAHGIIPPQAPQSAPVYPEAL